MIVHWLYAAIVRPILLYGNIVWWPSLEKNCNLRILHKIQRSAELCISGALRTTSTETLDLLAKSWASATSPRSTGMDNRLYGSLKYPIKTYILTT